MDNTKRKILLIEDEKFISDLYVKAFSKSNYDITTESNGEEALFKILSNTYDVILLDIMMPNITGTEILQRINKQLPERKGKIIITTNLELPTEDRNHIEALVDGYVIKASVTPKELVEYVDRLF